MKSVLPILLSTLLPLTGNPLKDYQWKNRILLVHSSTPLPDLREQKMELSDRDLIIVRLSPGQKQLPNEVELTSKERTRLRTRYKVPQKAPPTFILIGKDGGEKTRQKEKLDLKKIFALIDTMPMRKAEMREKSK